MYDVIAKRTGRRRWGVVSVEFGEQGPQGDPGPTGPQGPTGDQGPP